MTNETRFIREENKSCLLSLEAHFFPFSTIFELFKSHFQITNNVTAL